MTMAAAHYQEPKLTPETARAVEQGFFDFLIPFKGLTVRPDQAATVLRGKKDKLSFVYQMIQEGKLETLGPRDRDKARLLITRRSLVVLVAEQYDGDTEGLPARLAEVLATLTPAQYQQTLTLAGQRRQGR